MRGSTCRLACTFQGSSPMAAISSSAEEDPAGKSGRSGGLGGQKAKGSGSRPSVDAHKQRSRNRAWGETVNGRYSKDSKRIMTSNACASRGKCSPSERTRVSLLSLQGNCGLLQSWSIRNVHPDKSSPCTFAASAALTLLIDCNDNSSRLDRPVLLAQIVWPSKE
jgi:hypothetical protein